MRAKRHIRPIQSNRNVNFTVKRNLSIPNRLQLYCRVHCAMRDESSMSWNTTWMWYITRSRFSSWFRIYIWLTLFQQDNIDFSKKNYFQGCLLQKICLLVLAGSALQPVNKDRIYFSLCLLVGAHSFIVLKACVKRIHAFKTNKIKNRFPAVCQP